TPAADRAVEGQHILARGLNSRNAAGFGLSHLHELPCTAGLLPADVKMIAYQMQKGIIAYIRMRAMQSMPISARLGLLDKMEPACQIARRRDIRLLCAGADDQANTLDAGAEGFFENNFERRFG